MAPDVREKMDQRVTIRGARLPEWRGYVCRACELQRGTWLLALGAVGMLLGVTAFLVNLCASWDLVYKLPWDLPLPNPRACARAGALLFALAGLALNSRVQKRAVREQVRMWVDGQNACGSRTEKGVATSWLGKVLCLYAVLLWGVYFLMKLWVG